ncbi:polyribonucleotide nucleotidyltransferase [Marinilactibacillus psychrotolerans]|uniref:Polyribonucleotide nucleotidyltransferase n=1 Tax=Marinilactibacillus psychrotolerans TaxID=191770 RepID=A0AAV3WRM6_9LACT|nr:polyribonucleotide nucleotidyltransferase [Marinilactibacillus psychrotolerans]GEL66169.1 polyribonucleotide nucleotidyltransferase [Marinilactibacillus psychrotolerans]GEQ33456.1 polyribonucleotide nucleotidyltransferase [Marinilactibacillus psychrotolerans]GEQ34678.1 polyribonucleotide nucleotidyltransferase [Marinilactibacillus psychrotolerans]SDB95810.1 polyribonucleotide nucleotidyltransferase [Marinilactibacillus psychrotolerans]
MSEKKIFTTKIGGRTLTAEIGQMAKQANGAALLRYEDTVVLTAAVASSHASDRDFFPLMVSYEEKMYSVGKIPGGFIKREGRPSENATLTARLIDRPLRPMFAEGFRNEVQITNTVMSVDPDNSPEMTAMLGSSLSLSISNIPFNGPIAGVNVGRVNGELIINPTVEQNLVSDIHLTVAGTKHAINMVESGAEQVSEEDMLEALLFGHEAIKELVAFQEKIVEEIGHDKMEITLSVPNQELKEEITSVFNDKMKAAIQIFDKQERAEKTEAVKEEVINTYAEKFEDHEDKESIMKDVKAIASDMEKDEVRRLITQENVRPDGRKVDEIRSLESEVSILPRVHGSGLFTRGQTQALSVATLAPLNEYQIIDGLGSEDRKRFIHHYNFPQFSVGSTGPVRGPGRREIGHGALGERALAQVIPSEEDFPYTIRLVAEVLESNGSSSQASICAGTLALMDAGVPIKAPVGGIAMGLVMEGDDYTVLTDIQGLEDHLGDMDFKVAGTREGITALQMDIKIEGITKEILEEALTSAKKARLEILDNLEAAISNPRAELSEYAPKIESIRIKPEQIKVVIGKGGDTINGIIAETGVKIDIDEEGNVSIYGQDANGIKRAIEIIEELTEEVEIGKIYNGTVKRIEKFGAFVEIVKGKDGLVHVSELSDKYIKNVEDVISVGDILKVKVTEVDKMGRVNLSRKAVLEADNSESDKETK